MAWLSEGKGKQQATVSYVLTPEGKVARPHITKELKASNGTMVVVSLHRGWYDNETDEYDENAYQVQYQIKGDVSDNAKCSSWEEAMAYLQEKLPSCFKSRDWNF